MGGGVGDLVGAGLSAFGGNDAEGGGSSSQSMSGYAALPPEAQQAYMPYFNLVKALGNITPRATQYGQYNENPNSPFYSQGLGQLQAANPGQSINPIGLTEPFNPYQQSALKSLGNPDFSSAAMQQYTNPFQQQVQDTTINAINRQSGIDRNQLMSNNSLLNSRANSSSLGTQLAQNTDNKNRLIANATANLGYQGYNAGLDLRDKALQQQLGAGSAIQQQNQSALNTTTPGAAYSQLPQYIQASLLGPLFQNFPQSSTSSSSSYGATPASAGDAQKYGGLALGALSPNSSGSSIFSNIFG